MQRYISPFWMAYGAGLITLSPIWQDREDPDLELVDIAPPSVAEMAQWLKLAEGERADIVEGYATRRPAWRSDGERRRVAVGMD